MDDTGKAWARAGISIGTSLASSVIIMAVIMFITLPASYVMNRAIHHNWSMRAIVGAAAVVMWPTFMFGLSVMRIIGKFDKVHYFGQFPLFRSDAPASSGGWITPIFGSFLHNYVLEPLSMYWNEEAYTTTVEQMLAKKGDPVVDERVSKAARDAAKTPPNKLPKNGEKADWSDYKEKIAAIIAMKEKANPKEVTPPIPE